MTEATIFGSMRYDGVFTPITSRASICSDILCEPSSEAMREAHLPASMSEMMVGENSSIMAFLDANP